MNRLDEIEARANAATDGPWEADGLEGTITSKTDGQAINRQGLYLVVDGITMWAESDAEFIAAARTDVPALVAVARFALSQHAQDGHGNCGPCDDATGEDGWPCSTVREIHRLLGEDV